MEAYMRLIWDVLTGTWEGIKEATEHAIPYLNFVMLLAILLVVTDK
jgi:hypothetical protein